MYKSIFSSQICDILISVLIEIQDSLDTKIEFIVFREVYQFDISFQEIYQLMNLVNEVNTHKVIIQVCKDIIEYITVLYINYGDELYNYCGWYYSQNMEMYNYIDFIKKFASKLIIETQVKIPVLKI
jgi:hypothetical protein